MDYIRPTVCREAKLEENCELQGTDNVQGLISEHAFASNGGYCVYLWHCKWKMLLRKAGKNWVVDRTRIPCRPPRLAPYFSCSLTVLFPSRAFGSEPLLRRLHLSLTEMTKIEWIQTFWRFHFTATNISTLCHWYEFQFQRRIRFPKGMKE